ncbi:MAG: glycoside hydrolase family 127 protein [Armatimonadetes bacterium]|nr:glycoside hydrolase family 127 protein [Armatimonadota bacterium]
MELKVSTILVVAALMLAAAIANCAEIASPKPIKLLAQSFRLEKVRLLDSPFKTAMERNRKYLNDLDADRLLHTFRVTAGLPTTAQPLGGWESPNGELRGHSIGHFISGCALTYASAGDKAMKAKVDYIVAELAKCQQEMPKQGYNKGYLSAYPESFFDRVDNSQPVWAPWYTYHKIFAGLLDAYTYCGNKQALEALKKMSPWVKFRMDRLSEEKMQSSLNAEFGGIGESLANLYAITKNPDDLALARRFDKKCFTDPLAKGEDKLTGLHANTHIPQVIASARLYELTGEKRYEDISTFFWKQIVDARSFATGGTSNYEGWRSDPGKMASQISVESQESCCTYNMLKLTRQLFTWMPDAKEADYYERALYNGILSTIYPDTGMTMYYVAMKPGHWKIFGTPNNSFWCFTGTGMENHAKYGDSIYFHDDKSLYINLFIPSELDYTEKGMKARMETEFPEKDTISIAFTAKKPVDMAVKIRVPYWATNGVTVKINGKPEKVEAKPVSYLTLQRKWKTGDKIELKIPMSLHLAPMPDDANLAAVMYGPIVLAAQLGTKDFTKDMQFANDQREKHNGPSIDVPCFVASGKPVDDWVKPVSGKNLTWRTDGVGKPNDVTLIPFYKLFDERYTIYMRLHTPESYQAIKK